MNIQVCNSFSDAVPLYLPQQLLLKPVSKINVSIQLPSSKALGKTISNWELMERMRELIRPDLFSSLKVSKSSVDAIRFEGELDDRKRISNVVSCLDERSIKLNGYPESLKLKASEAKLEFPSRHAWDSFFRDAPNMDEMKPGERPDTVHISNLPIKWFLNSRDLQDEDAKPSENIFRRVFEKFGKVRCVDIPICDPYRKQMKPHMTGISKFSFDSELYFEGYVQFSEYMGFVRAMDAFRGMKLLKKGEDGVGQAVSIDVNFDTTKHLSEATIKRRSIVRERLVTQERSREEKEKQESVNIHKKEEAERRKRDQSEREKLTHMQEREQRRKAKQLAKLKQREASEINSKIAEEQKKLLRTQRKLQSIRLIEELFRRIQLKQKHTSLYRRDELQMNPSSKDKKKELKMLEKALLNEGKEKNVRDRLVSKYKSAQEQELEDQRLKLRKAIEGNIVLRSVLDTGKKKARTPSISSLSSGSDISINDGINNKKIKSERLLTPERNMLIPKEEDGMVRGYPPNYGYGPYAPYLNQNYTNYHQPPPGPFYPRGGYYPQQGAPEGYGGRGRGYAGRRPRAPRGVYRGGMPRMPYFDGPNAHHAYYKYFKKLTEESGDRNNRDHSYSRSRSRSRRRSYTRSRSRSRSYSRSRSRKHSSSRHRSRYSRSRSRMSRSRSRNRRTRTRSRSRHSRHSRSRSRSHKSRSRSRHRSHDRRSRSKHSRDSKSRNKSPAEDKQSKTENNPEKRRTESIGEVKSSKQSSKSPKRNVEEERGAPQRHRSKSWSMPRDTAKEKSWSKSPSKRDV